MKERVDADQVVSKEQIGLIVEEYSLITGNVFFFHLGRGAL